MRFLIISFPVLCVVSENFFWVVSLMPFDLVVVPIGPFLDLHIPFFFEAGNLSFSFSFGPSSIGNFVFPIGDSALNMVLVPFVIELESSFHVLKLAMSQSL